MMGACLYFTDRYDGGVFVFSLTARLGACFISLTAMMGACLYFTDRYDGGMFVFH